MSSPSSPPVLSPQEAAKKLEHDWGPMMIGVFCETFVLGGIASQATHYFGRCSRDSALVKLMIAVLVSSVVVKTVLDVEDVYQDHIFRLSAAPPAKLPPLLLVRSFLGEIPLVVSQLFLSHRVYMASQWKILPALIGVIGSLASCALMLVFGVTRVMYPQPMINRQKVAIWIPPWAFTTAAVNVYLSATLTYFLLQTRKKAQSYRLNFMLSRLASLVVKTCFPPAIMACLMAILEIVEKPIVVWVFFHLLLACVYTVCILYSLNSRKGIVADAISHSLKQDPTGAGLAATSRSRSDPSHPSLKGRAQPMTPLFNHTRDSRHVRAVGTNSDSASRAGGNVPPIDVELELTAIEKPLVISTLGGCECAVVRPES